MQTLSWYVRRLQAMSPEEIAWRARSTIRDVTDRYRVGLGLYPRAAVSAPAPAAPTWCPVPLGAWRDRSVDDPAAVWRARLVDRADRIAAGRLSFFDLRDVAVGDPVDWHREYAAGRPTPRTFAASIDYRDYAVTGDAKVVWEPNRHHHLVVLGRAYRATGDEPYAAAAARHLSSWIDANPFGYGMNWRSPLELAIRVINWTWAVDLIAGSAALDAALFRRVADSAALHVWDIARKYSRGSSANNHRIGEAAGVFVATSYFSGIPDAAALRAESHRILSEEISAQTYPSGATREQAFGYHLFVLNLFLAAGIAGRRSGMDFDAAFWSALERMFAFAGAMAAGGPPPYYGDSDDGCVLDLGDSTEDIGALMSLGAALFGGDRFRGGGDPPSESAFWLLGRRAERHDAAAVPLESVAFEDAGLYLLQSGGGASREGVSVVVDCGELGFGTLAAHGHADALSVVVRANGAEVLVDPGTYDYFSFPAWRQYFRGTRAHNTVTIDGADQSTQLGSFLWGQRAAARCLEWRQRPGGGTVRGEHDGYRRLQDPVGCTRTVDLEGRTVTIDDEIASGGPHDVEINFHLSDDCEAAALGHRVDIRFAAGRAVMNLDDRLELSLVKGGETPDSGWMSRGYHRRTPAWIVRARMRTTGGVARIRTVLEIL